MKKQISNEDKAARAIQIMIQIAIRMIEEEKNINCQ